MTIFKKRDKKDSNLINLRVNFGTLDFFFDGQEFSFDVMEIKNFTIIILCTIKMII